MYPNVGYLTNLTEWFQELDPVLRQIRKITKHPLYVAKKCAETYSSSNAAAREDILKLFTQIDQIEK